jgi:hypothetical protein
VFLKDRIAIKSADIILDSLKIEDIIDEELVSQKIKEKFLK